MPLSGPAERSALIAGVDVVAAVEGSRYLSPRAAAEFLQERGFTISEKTLAKYRCVGTGPSFRHFGRFPRYREDWLEEWARSQISGRKRSTSDPGELPAGGA